MIPKTQNLEGRQHYVLPLVLGVAGVWTGSNGALFYPPGELAKSVPHWNGRPIVIYHPYMYNNHCANNPAVYNRQRVGTLFNVRFDPVSKKLAGEAWLDPERLKAVDSRVLAAVQSGKVMEVSTGLFTGNEMSPGSFNGRAYKGIARDHRPDHLAILPDQTGACSVAMGAGLCRNFSRGEEPLRAPCFEDFHRRTA